LAETDLSGNTTNEYIFFVGARIARRDSAGNVYYYFGDYLGSSRSITNATGTICYEADFYPFGGERVLSNTCGQNYKFAGMERDSETGNDQTWFRYYASNLGRWLSPDPVAGSIFDPQSLNRYAYVLNNPCNLIDPLGLSDCNFYINIENSGLLSQQEWWNAWTELASILGQANLGAVFSQDNADFTINLMLYPPSLLSPYPARETDYGRNESAISFPANSARVRVNNISSDVSGKMDVGTAVGRVYGQELGHWAFQVTDLAPGIYAGGMMDHSLEGILSGSAGTPTPPQIAALSGKCEEQRYKRRGGGPSGVPHGRGDLFGVGGAVPPGFDWSWLPVPPRPPILM
jgi:RHS repeat-associated protein